MALPAAGTGPAAVVVPQPHPAPGPVRDLTGKSTARRHGGQWPWNAAQIAAWILLASLGFLFFGIVVHALQDPVRYVVAVGTAVFYVAHWGCLAVCTFTDPRDDGVDYTIAGFPVTFDRTKRRHVILDGHCILCDAHVVDDTTKHCRACNKCVGEFDHHCKWMNNCVGGKTYRLFLACIFAGTVASLMVSVVSVVIFAMHFADRSVLRDNFDSNGNRQHAILGSAVPDGLFLTLDALLGLLSLAAFAMLLHLSAFHIMLLSREMSTYDYIKWKRDMRQRHLSQVSMFSVSSLPPQHPQPEPPRGGCCNSKNNNNKRNNKVAPVGNEMQPMPTGLAVPNNNPAASLDGQPASRVKTDAFGPVPSRSETPPHGQIDMVPVSPISPAPPSQILAPVPYNASASTPQGPRFTSSPARVRERSFPSLSRVESLKEVPLARVGPDPSEYLRPAGPDPGSNSRGLQPLPGQVEFARQQARQAADALHAAGSHSDAVLHPEQAEWQKDTEF